MDKEIRDKIITITGASSGIGKATAILLAEQGDKVVLGARRADQLQSIVNQIKANGGKPPTPSPTSPPAPASTTWSSSPAITSAD